MTEPHTDILVLQNGAPYGPLTLRTLRIEIIIHEHIVPFARHSVIDRVHLAELRLHFLLGQLSRSRLSFHQGGLLYIPQ